MGFRGFLIAMVLTFSGFTLAQAETPAQEQKEAPKAIPAETTSPEKAKPAEPNPEQLAKPLVALLKNGDPEQMLSPEDAKNMAELTKSLHALVVKEIEDEAKKLKIDRDPYVDSEESFTKFVTDLKALEIEKMSDEAVFVQMLKTGLRLQIQRAVRFIPKNYFENEKTTLDQVKRMTDKLKIKSFF